MACLSVEKPPQTRVQTLLSAKRKTAIICLHATWTTLLVVVVVVVVAVAVVVVVVVAVVVVVVAVVVVVEVVVVVVEEEEMIIMIIMIIITIAVVITLLIPLGTGITNNSSHHRSGINCGTTVHGSMAATIRLTTIMRVANRKAIKNSDDRTT